MAFDFKSLIGPAIGAGATILGSQLQGNAANQNSQRQWELLQQEMQRRNMLQGMAAPSLLRGLGYRNPQQISQMSSQIGGNPSGYGGTSAAPASIPSTPSSIPSKVLGIGGAAAGAGIPIAASLMGYGALGGPLGLAVGGIGALGSMALNKIGQGRRTANQFVGAVENPFGQELAQASRGEIGKDQLVNDYQNYLNQEKAWEAQGGNQAKVAKQSLNNQALQQTIRTLLTQYGVPNLYQGAVG